jgi:hypothetical protein
MTSWIGLMKAAALAGRSSQWVQSRALAGKIRFRLLPGEKPHYYAPDVEQARSEAAARREVSDAR